jgi:hypothetical protein
MGGAPSTVHPAWELLLDPVDLSGWRRNEYVR